MENSLDLDLDQLSEAFLNLYGTDTELISQSTSYIEEVKNDPESILLFLHVILTTDNDKIRKAAISTLLNIVDKKWDRMPESIQEEARQLIIEILSIELKFDELSMMAGICADIFRAMKYWDQIIKSICIAYQNSDLQFATLFMSNIFPLAPDETLKLILPAFQNMASKSIHSEDQETFMNAVNVLILIGLKIKDVSVVEEVIDLLMKRLANSNPKDNNSIFSRLWQFVRNILSIENVEDSTIEAFYNVASQIVSDDSIGVDNRGLVISAFEPTIPIILKDILLEILSVSLDLALAYISIEEKLPSVDYLSFLDESLLKRHVDVSEFVKSKFVELSNTDEEPEIAIPKLILSLSILRSLLQYSPDSLNDESEIIQSSIQESLTSDNELILCASLKVIDILDMQFNESDISSISVQLMEKVVPLLNSESEIIRSHATNAFLSLCDMCDTEVEDLFNHLWSLKTDDSIPCDSVSDFLFILAKVINISKNIPDDQQDEVIKFIEEFFSASEENYISEKSASLSVISALFIKNTSLMQELLPKIDPVLEILINCDEDDNVCQSLNFLDSLAKTFRQDALEFISKYEEAIVNFIIQHNDEKRYYLSSMRTAASIIKYCEEQALVEPMVKEIISIFQFSGISTLTEACYFISLMSKSLAEVDPPTVLEIYNILVHIIKEQNDNQLLYNCLTAISKLFKRCRQNNIESYDQITEELILLIFTGQIKYLNNNEENLYILQSEMAGYMLELIDVYLRTNPPNINDIFEDLYKWMINADEDVVSNIIGAIAESLKRIEIDAQLLSSIIDHLLSIAKDVKVVKLRHNIAYFLSTFLATFNDQTEIVSQFIPALDSWWNEGREKQFGYQKCLANIAVLYLRLFVSGAQIPYESVSNAISCYPPADKTETENMSQLILQIFNENQENTDLMNEILENTAIALADLLSQPPNGINMMKISPETLEQIQDLFKAILSGNDELKNKLAMLYEKNTEKLEMISQYFS